MAEYHIILYVVPQNRALLSRRGMSYGVIYYPNPLLLP